jgi:hypothetical protein
MRAPAVSLVVLSALVAAPRLVRAVDLQERYEDALVAQALADANLVPEPAPEGKLIERIVIRANNVLMHGDFGILSRVPVLSIAASTFPNKLHVRTREHVIARELLFHVGEPFRAALVDESARNLRGFFILAVARIVVARGSTPDRVVVLVVTKDQWSLRLNTNFTVDQARLDFLSFSISESNLAGRNKTAAIDFALDPGRYTVGAGYTDPRVAGSRHALTLGADVFLDRQTSQPEGVSVSAGVGRPLYSLATKWAWQASFSYVQDKVRFFRGGDLDVLVVGQEKIPEIYAARVIGGSIAGTRSFGILNKLNLSLGFRVDSAQYGLTSDFPSTASATARAVFLASLPRSEDSSGPYGSINAYRAEYVRLQNIETFALSEDYRLGPTASLGVRYAAPFLGFDSNFVELTASYGAAYLFRGDLFSFSAGGILRIQTGALSPPPPPLANVAPSGSILYNEEVAASVRNVSPIFGPFRLILYGALRLRNHDLNRLRLAIGSDSGLRGYAPRQFQGNSRYEINAELRTLALNLWTVHVGGVVFYDAGDAPASLEALGYHQDAGVGVRILFPQFNHDVLRLDLAFPFETTMGAWAPRFSAAFGQAF